MKIASGFRADAPAAAAETEPASGPVLIWDAPVRVFHWLMVICFAVAYLTAESERWRLVHVTSGYTMAGLVAFRLIWGFAGTRYARFANFVRGPAATWSYLRDVVAGGKPRHLGHNPAGAVAIVTLLVLTAAVVVTGWAVYNDTGGKGLEEAHEVVANAMLAVVGIHVAGVLFASWLHRESLIGAMVTGRKPAKADDAVRSPRWGVAALLLAGVLGFWWLQWHDAPQASTGVAAVAGSRPSERTDD